MLDPDPEAPARHACHEFQCGSLRDFDTVYQFGKDCTVLTIEIEHVNVDALIKLKEEGVLVHPDPHALEIICDKGLQKIFYKSSEFPTTDFMLFDNKDEVLVAIEQGDIAFPFVQKSRRDGYDGRGVQLIHSSADTHRLLDTPCLIEEMVDVKMEIAVIAARNQQGQVVCYDAAAMDFVSGANLLDLLIYPAEVSADLEAKAKQLAAAIIDKLNICGLLAVEFLIDQQDRIFINEVAPRPHNSGHQTIESSETSQYEQHLRGILGLPLGSTNVLIPSVMVNLLGAEGYEGPVVYENMDVCLEKEGVHIHLYGKNKTKPFRKMGHVTVTHQQLNEAKNKREKPLVGIIMGSDSDWNVMKDASDFLTSQGIQHECTIVSAHRTPKRMMDYATKAADRGIQVIIAGAGGAAHLPGMVASITSLPVIGVPVRSSNSIDGWDSILSILQMPNGVPVATVALNASKNAGILALQILGASNAVYREQISQFKKSLEKEVLKKASQFPPKP